ncbi:hypothetical protein EG328_010760 [Venturia inaequalis]|uniref:Uncharacterized protein n=1 Tax=Venturia inaequalis TaxID=5025 RepID=A0A8H3Z2A3_VENIN|nr:hypothetical protein EG328_010760 [Venturia inaequalis]RDI85966.1 hypothetical protein Vi05172_g4185 [Venturia inaequalis]
MMKFAPFITALFWSLHIIAAPADISPRIEGQYLKERAWWDTAKPANNNAALPADPGVQVWGSANGIGFGSKNGLTPKPQATDMHATIGLGQQAASPPSTAAQPYIAPQPAQQAQPAAPQLSPPQPAQWTQSLTSNSQAGKVTSISVTTKQDTVFCRRFPDTITSDNLGLRVFAGNANVELTCWTNAAIDGPAGRVNQNGLWVKTNLGCYINDADVNARIKHNFQQRLEQCPVQAHFVGTLQSQYKREDCYSCPSLNCSSQNLGVGPLVDLDCSTEGDAVGGSKVWYKQVDKNCFYPGGVFENTRFMGTKPQMCLKTAT